VIVPPNTLATSNFSRSRATELWLQALGGHTAVFYDHLGAGLSQRDKYDFSLEGLVRELNAVVGALDIEAFSIYAQATAGPVALRFAAENHERVRALCLVRSWARGADYLSGQRGAGYLDGLRGDWELASQMFARMVGAAAQWPEAAAQLMRETCEQSTYLEYLAAIVLHDVTDLLPSISVPTLVWSLTDDLFIDVEVTQESATTIPDSQLQLLPRGSGGMERVESFFNEALAAGRSGSAAAGPAGGFQTILFTDLESSTELTQGLGDEGAQELLRGHNDAVRAALEEHGDREVEHTGDGIMASFPSAVAAVTAALQMQRDLDGAEERVRIGLNAGEPIAEDDDLFGLSVIEAARIGDRAEPGQVLVSDVVRQLCEGKTFEFTLLGDATLKGFDEPVALYEMRAGA
jgi:class 3 adenylate cyclase/pimeloyl-ACP methyl ester carboxylesterase